MCIINLSVQLNVCGFSCLDYAPEPKCLCNRFWTHSLASFKICIYLGLNIDILLKTKDYIGYMYIYLWTD